MTGARWYSAMEYKDALAVHLILLSYWPLDPHKGITTLLQALFMTTCTMPPHVNLTDTLGVAFVGLIFATVLFGITIFQAYRYFNDYSDDRLCLRLIVAILCFLDFLCLGFSTHMMYYYLVTNYGNPLVLSDEANTLWSIKVVATIQVITIWLVQGTYLSRLCILFAGIDRCKRWRNLLKIGIALTALVAFGSGIVVLIEINGATYNIMYSRFEWVQFQGYTVATIIDSGIAIVMCCLLRKSTTGIKRTDCITNTIMQYVVSTGLLTSLCSITCIILFAVKPGSLLYVALSFSVTRLYVNSFLAMYNARIKLRGDLNRTVTLNTVLLFGVQSAPDLEVGVISEVMHKENHLEPGPGSPVRSMDIVWAI